MDDRWAAKLEELRVGAASHGVEWLHSALSELFRDELRPLAAAGGVETRPDNKWLTVAQLHAHPRENGRQQYGRRVRLFDSRMS